MRRCLAEMKDPDKDKYLFATLGEAVGAYLATQPVEGVDWQDRTP